MFSYSCSSTALSNTIARCAAILDGGRKSEEQGDRELWDACSRLGERWEVAMGTNIVVMKEDIVKLANFAPCRYVSQDNLQ